MRKDNHLDYEELFDDNDNSQNDNLSLRIPQIVTLIAAIPSAIISAVQIMSGNDYWWLVAISTLLLCIVIGVLCIIILNAKKIKKVLNVFLFLVLSFSLISFIALLVYKWQYIFPTPDKDMDSATDMEQQSSISDTQIIVDLSSHSMHEKEQDKDLNEPELQPVIQMSKESFMRRLQAASKGEIRGESYQRYRGDKEQQLFAIVEEATEYEKMDEENLYGTIWYVDKYGPKEIDSEAKEYKWAYLFFLDDSNENLYLVYKQYRPEGNVVYVLGVDKTGPFHPPISGQGSNLHINKDEIEITTENGVYYFCVEGSFREYGGLEISLVELLNIEDVKIENIVKSLYEEECQIHTIFYRENGIININFSHEYEAGEVRHYHLTLRYDGEQIQILPAKSGEKYDEGIYLDALIPEIATYPSEFPY